MSDVPPARRGLPQLRNPYDRADGSFHLQRSVVCFLDILGYREMLVSGGAEVQRELHSALAESYPILLGELGYFENDPTSFPEQFAMKTFTDNIVLARPIYRSDSEGELGNLVMACGALQTQLAIRGFFVRGAISIGPAYVDDFGVFGEALVEAYSGEQRLARDPRIVLCASARQEVVEHIGYYADADYSPQNRELRQDTDGQAFVSYLEHLAPAPDEPGGFGLVEVRRHRDVVEGQLQAFQRQPRIWAKYEWVARYHNHFCDLYEPQGASELKIELDTYRGTMTNIT